MIVILDNGHGKSTLGKKSPDGTLLEYKWAREMVQIINNKLTKLGIKTHILVPEVEEDISIGTRVKRANEVYLKNNKEAILISVHCNAASNNKWTDARGWSVFVSKKASKNSKKLANLMFDEAKNKNVLGNRAIPSEHYWTWNWTTADIGILTNTFCPAVLTENMFMDNKQDVEFLLSDKGKEILSDIHVNAIIKYINEH